MGSRRDLGGERAVMVIFFEIFLRRSKVKFWRGLGMSLGMAQKLFAFQRRGYKRLCLTNTG